MNYRSKLFILTGIYGLAASFVAQQLFSNYYYGEFGLNVLPINLFELLIFWLGVLCFFDHPDHHIHTCKKEYRPGGF